MKAYREYERDRKPIDALTDEDKFLLQVINLLNLNLNLDLY